MSMFTYDLDWLLAKSDAGERLKYLSFWGHTESKVRVTKACFSQWYDSSFAEGGRTYATAEHWMMAEKAKLFGDDEVYEKVFTNDKPGAAKAFGRSVRGFIPEIWDAKKYEIVVAGNFLKFSQNPALSNFLLSTAPRVLVEASPVDTIWGVGLAHDDPHVETPTLWRGQNLLGFALMEVRDQLALSAS